ncbi:unnamed protein product [Lupinus luteus]|uniref:Uncharacterized protein n=1 Tax=Lupinus luteus TaxID=3873 RepID=A0AAV1XDX9_LUPLU
MIKGRETKAAPSTDLLVCFPSRAHLSLMPKPICSPARPSEPNKLGRHHRRKRSVSKGGGGGQAASPILWAKSTKSMGSEISEPTSPKVTCAGQIKVRPKTNACRNWQSVMEEIEKIHNDKKQKKRLNWAETLGFKKEVMQFLTCLRSIRFDLRCFGSFPGTDIATEDDNEEDEDDVEDEERYHENHVKLEEGHENETSRTVFSKWFMVLQENNQNNELREKDKVIEDGETISENNVPPPNALLLMRCRSAPAKSWLKEESGGGGNHHEEKEKEEIKVKVLKKGQSLKSLMEKEKINKENNMIVMQYDNDFYELSADIAKETWIVGDLRDSLSRSRSCKR